MRLAEFDFELPEERIAQQPAERRDESRLLELDRRSGGIAHHRFAALKGLLRAGDLLVLNDTRVLAARLIGRKKSGGRVEVLLLERVPGSEGEVWSCLVKASRAPGRGDHVELGEGVRAEVLERDGARFHMRFDAVEGDVESRLSRIGAMPLPPYIRRPADAPRSDLDRERYQTVFARRPGAVVAPTAGLHFTQSLLEALRGAGIDTAFVTLHVGLGTFEPIRVERVEEHRMHDEWCVLPPATASAVERTRARGGRIVAVGTTVVRTLESRAGRDGTLADGAGRCDLFIYPGFEFRVVDALITNFHLPRSTLLLLVAAFAGRERVLDAYREAIDTGYRFYSYGDAMLIH